MISFCRYGAQCSFSMILKSSLKQFHHAYTYIPSMPLRQLQETRGDGGGRVKSTKGTEKRHHHHHQEKKEIDEEENGDSDGDGGTRASDDEVSHEGRQAKHKVLQHNTAFRSTNWLALSLSSDKMSATAP